MAARMVCASGADGHIALPAGKLLLLGWDVGPYNLAASDGANRLAVITLYRVFLD
jgi:hypothetical protein